MVVAHRAEREHVREPVGLLAGERERLHDDGGDARGDVLALARADVGRRQRGADAQAERRVPLPVQAPVDRVPVAGADDHVVEERLVRVGSHRVGAVRELGREAEVDVDVGLVDRLVDEVVPRVEREAHVVGRGGGDGAQPDADGAGRERVPPREAGEVERALLLLLLWSGVDGVGPGHPEAHRGHGLARAHRRGGQRRRRNAELDRGGGAGRPEAAGGAAEAAGAAAAGGGGGPGGGGRTGRRRRRDRPAGRRGGRRGGGGGSGGRGRRGGEAERAGRAPPRGCPGGPLPRGSSFATCSSRPSLPSPPQRKPGRASHTCSPASTRGSGARDPRSRNRTHALGLAKPRRSRGKPARPPGRRYQPDAPAPLRT